MSLHFAQATPAMSRKRGPGSDDENDRPLKRHMNEEEAPQPVPVPVQVQVQIQVQAPASVPLDPIRLERIRRLFEDVSDDSDNELENEETAVDGAVPVPVVEEVDDGAVPVPVVEEVDDRPPELAPSADEIRRSIPYLGRILGSEAGEFIPSARQVRMLAQEVQRGNILDFSRLSIRRWHDALWASDGGVLFHALDHGQIERIFDDQMLRAHYLARLCVQNRATQIVLMDGHGRFLLCLIHELIGQGVDLDNVAITFVDIDEHADSWHQAFFPRDTYAVCTDVLEYMVDSYQHYLVDESDADTDLPDPRSTIFYLNFCAVSNAIANFERIYGFKAFSKLMVDYAPLRNTMFSYSIRNINRLKSAYVNIRKLNLKFKLFELVSSRGNFCTAFVRHE